MRQPRLTAPQELPKAVYHCLSRVINREFVLGPAERDQFLIFMREYEAFCGVRILTYCILSNHFHLLIEVPQRPTQLPDSETLIQKLEAISGNALKVEDVRQKVHRFRQSGDAEGEKKLREQLCGTMWTVSGFMKLLKQRFTQWFNRQKGRRGYLWEERFRSVLVEGTGTAITAMAGYIDLNPVRAGLVSDPKDYPWCGYGEAAAGGQLALKGIRSVIAAGLGLDESKENPATTFSQYRDFLLGSGKKEKGATAERRAANKEFNREEGLAEIKQRRRLEMEDYLRLKVRYFADGSVLGSKEFVEEVFRATRNRYGDNRKSGARRMKGLASELYTIRDLQVRVIE